MRDVMHSVIFAFREILEWDVMKYALLVGLVVSAIWGIVGHLLWDHIVGIGAYLLELVPFSMVRSNGAWMLSSFLWFGLVLLTFALIFAFFGNFFLRSISKDRYNSISLLVALFSALLWGIIWYFKSDYIYHQFLKLLTWLPFETVEKGIGYFIGFYIIYNAIIVTMVFVANIFSKPLINSVERRHFLDDDLKDHSFKTIGYTIKDSLIFLAISLLFIPIIFIPILNILVMLALWVWLVRDTFRYDAISLLNIDKKSMKEYNFATWVISAISALFNFVPVLNLFGPFFGEIAMFDYLKRKFKTN